MKIKKGIEEVFWKFFGPSINKGIPGKIREAEKIPNLSKQEKVFLDFLKTQLEIDWQTPCINMLDEMIKAKDLAPKKRMEKMEKLLKTELRKGKK